MKTQPSVKEGLRDLQLSRTDEQQKPEVQDGNATEKQAYTQVQVGSRGRGGDNDGVVQNLDCTNDFSFEKERIRAIEHTQLYTTLHSATVNADIAVAIRAQTILGSKLSVEGRHLEQKWKTITHVQRVLSFICILYAISDMLLTFFAVIFLSISSLPIMQYLLWIGAELGATLGFIYLTLKGYNTSRYEEPTVSQHILRVCVFLFLLLVLAVTVILERGANDTLASALNWNKEGCTYEENVEAMISITVLALLLSTLLKICLTLLYLVLSVLMKLTLAQKRALPCPSESAPATEQLASVIDKSPIPYKL
jgi:hypothetical protein